jgi:uncharacterized protein
LLLRWIRGFAAALLGAAILYGAETPLPEAPKEWVTDTANFLSPETVRSLNARLGQYEQSTGHQVIVYIAPTTGDTPIEDWAVRAFAKWKVGRKGLDDGLALFLFPQDRKVRIEVGYGLEPVVPDAIASRVINDVIVPRIQAGKRDEAVTAAVDSLTGVIDRQSSAFPRPTPKASTPSTGWESILWSLLGFLLLAVLFTAPRLALYFLTVIFSSGGRSRGRGGRTGWGGGTFGGGGGFGWGGGGSGWGGGFGGAGGRSGGGGATGSW